MRPERQRKIEEWIFDPGEKLLVAIFGFPYSEEEGQPMSIVPPEFKSEFQENLIKALETLTGRERRVLSLRFGLSGGVPKTLREVGEIEGNYLMGKPYTRDWMRQIEKKALSKLRHPRRSKFLKPFFSPAYRRDLFGN